MKRSRGDPARLGYHNHYVVDGGKDRIILADLVTPASVMDDSPSFLLSTERSCDRVRQITSFSGSFP